MGRVQKETSYRELGMVEAWQEGLFGKTTRSIPLEGRVQGDGPTVTG